jgi:hypothetical protein
MSIRKRIVDGVMETFSEGTHYAVHHATMGYYGQKHPSHEAAVSKTLNPKLIRPEDYTVVKIENGRKKEATDLHGNKREIPKGRHDKLSESTNHEGHVIQLHSKHYTKPHYKGENNIVNHPKSAKKYATPEEAEKAASKTHFMGDWTHKVVSTKDAYDAHKRSY